jgi:hypothetical protein
VREIGTNGATAWAAVPADRSLIGAVTDVAFAASLRRLFVCNAAHMTFVYEVRPNTADGGEKGRVAGAHSHEAVCIGQWAASAAVRQRYGHGCFGSKQRMEPWLANIAFIIRFHCRIANFWSSVRVSATFISVIFIFHECKNNINANALSQSPDCCSLPIVWAVTSGTIPRGAALSSSRRARRTCLALAEFPFAPPIELLLGARSTTTTSVPMTTAQMHAPASSSLSSPPLPMSPSLPPASPSSLPSSSALSPSALSPGQSGNHADGDVAADHRRSALHTVTHLNIGHIGFAPMHTATHMNGADSGFVPSAPDSTLLDCLASQRLAASLASAETAQARAWPTKQRTNIMESLFIFHQTHDMLYRSSQQRYA